MSAIAAFMRHPVHHDCCRDILIIVATSVSPRGALIDACKMELATAVALNEDVVAVITSNHNNVDTRCWCTCWLAQVIWCIGETQGDAHSIASSVLAVAVVTVRLYMHCAGTAITNTTNLDSRHPLCNLLDCICISSSKSNQQLPRP